MGMEFAMEFRDQASATRMPPRVTTMRGPNLSTNQLSTGTSQVSARTKKLKAPAIAARDQPCAFDIGSTNRFQPYCRLAIITMQMMPIKSWSQRPFCSPCAEVSVMIASFLWNAVCAAAIVFVFPQALDQNTFGRRPDVKHLSRRHDLGASQTRPGRSSRDRCAGTAFANAQRSARTGGAHGREPQRDGHRAQ